MVLLFAEMGERQRTVRFADEVENSGGESQSSKSAGTTSIQDFLLKMAGQPLPDKPVSSFNLSSFNLSTLPLPGTLLMKCSVSDCL